MSKEDESERFKRLAEENPMSIYDAIEESEEPWWGFGILAQPRMCEIKDDERIRGLIEHRSHHMLETISTSSQPWLVIWNIQSYVWFFEKEETIDAVANAIRNSVNPAQCVEDIQHIRKVMQSKSVKSAFLHALARLKMQFQPHQRQMNGSWRITLLLIGLAGMQDLIS